MSEADVTISREEQMLGELAELDLALAKRVHAKAMTAEEPDQINAFSRTYQRIARSVRQSLIAKAKLAREREAAAARRRSLDLLDGFGDGFGGRFDPRFASRPPAPSRASRDLAAQAVRIGETFAAVRPLVERERPDYDETDDLEIHTILRELAEYDDFVEVPVAVLVDRVLEILDYPAAGAAALPAEAEPSDPPVHDTA
ncbi:MAG: hypothetical protein KKE02_05855 [Alphaproteobacteria bacterium]|nr:hypothetical protein [Alphaproteobacteria bacterium]MBU1512918.1 hypothetical protein [Alphaproteobacteria bacterium]MBU2096641.1 hypothetical protein [Alphaproteobacteria bacterium]MBU2150524.1 hypothetical protein [Alphaproteobacteria bacterium]MBU2306547.1 hypothetical protein [Alphaproteobacteria bacterium]